ncbi:uncharacterized protein FIBRA_07588 [Fibroporia radiculosa]|uniref:Cytochrome P450 n=1 Tax=Fibroporia radiculosa TaxID=599839 RepID=J4I0Y2_9APHY|nr:uncharacterized protein FIBRA_07588 [Fibroporia radiculosa]CCM05372.1 predicted protein [Fibroporia radiculosa]
MDLFHVAWLGAILVSLVLWKLFKQVSARQISPLRDIPGPPNVSWLWGNSKQIFKADVAVLQEAWTQQFGSTIKYKDFLSNDVLYTVDLRAINHILTHSNEYRKPEIVRFKLAALLGEGLLCVEGEQHRQQRRVMNPAFGPAQIRELTEIFVEKAVQLRDVWRQSVCKDGNSACINVSSGLSKMAFDVIGLAGFNYDFDSLNSQKKPSELTNAFKALFSQSTSKPSILQVLSCYVPFFRPIAKAGSVQKSISIAHDLMKHVGLQIIRDSEADIMRMAELKNTHKKNETMQGRDLLTVLIKANMDSNISESHRLSDEEVLAQILTFLVAGHDTTSNGTAWALYALSQAQHVQQKLREELWSVPTDNPTMDELLELPYLDAVIRETLRLHAPVAMAKRVATKDDIIPLQTPYTDTRGKVHDSIKIPQGTYVDIPILAINRSKALWGEDALAFKPERWDSIPTDVQSIPGVWGNMLSFLGGPRSCIGYRFSIIEMKALIFTLIRGFEFELAVPASSISASRGLVQRPRVRGEEEQGAQLPMLLKPCTPRL